MKNLFIKNLQKYLLIFTFLLLPLVSFGQQSTTGTYNGNNSTNSNNSTTTLKNPLKYETINEFLKAIVEGVLKLGIPIIVLAIIYSGFLFVTALGNPTKLEKAKEAFLYTVIGAAILLGSWGLAQLISETIIQISK